VGDTHTWQRVVSLRLEATQARCKTIAGLIDGKSFIQIGGLSFLRTEEARASHSADEGFTGLVEVVVFEKSQQHLVGYQGEVCNHTNKHLVLVSSVHDVPAGPLTSDGWPYHMRAGQVAVLLLRGVGQANKGAVQNMCLMLTSRHPPSGMPRENPAVQCQLNHVYIAPATSQGTPPPADVNLLQQPNLLNFGVENSSDVSIQYHGLPWRAEVDFVDNMAQSNRIDDGVVTINQTGVYIMWFIACDPALAEVRGLVRDHGSSLEL
jgi:hypothetical protein